MDCSSHTEAPESFTRIEAFLQLLPVNDNNALQILDQLKALRNLCAVDPMHQNIIAEHEEFNAQLHKLLFNNSTIEIPQNILLIALQLLANAIVQNPNSQRNIWRQHGDAIVECCHKPPLGRHTDILLMIMYNVLKGGAVSNMEQQSLGASVCVWQTIVQERSEASCEFLHFIFEHFIVYGGHNTVRYYAHLTPMQRISFLEYLVNYLRQDSPNGRIHQFLLKYITKEFNIKSDRILVCKRDGTQASATVEADSLPAREGYALLRVIASASGSELYGDSYAKEQSLFLNVSSLLRCLAQVGKQSQNIFTPMTKLEEVALTSDISRDFESEVSFELKTLLVRCIANLLYKNAVNQGYCIDTQLLPTLLECTNMDARNPLLKEWSVLAIRNACFGCPEIQAMIANMTNQGAAQNDIIDELNLDMGALRIKPNRG
ncbi:ataxin-10 [Rhagoletis pomonella]|uniref:ataxin-10 n=1 Tax=Rhagoletis pomonella TaxID=28610 RepID=UPI001787494E|nr:ataxin-10 [Rhagoletis pomonella]